MRGEEAPKKNVNICLSLMMMWFCQSHRVENNVWWGKLGQGYGDDDENGNDDDDDGDDGDDDDDDDGDGDDETLSIRSGFQHLALSGSLTLHGRPRLSSQCPDHYSSLYLNLFFSDPGSILVYKC